jgi:hypothetical protein
MSAHTEKKFLGQGMTPVSGTTVGEKHENKVSVPDHLPFLVLDSRRPVQQHPLEEIPEISAAHVAHASSALRANTAWDHPRDPHMIPFLHRRHAGTCLLHDARTLVPAASGRAMGFPQLKVESSGSILRTRTE